MEWWKKFWNAHGERLIYMALALGLASGLYYYGMQAEAKTIYIGTAMLCYNKARGNGR